MLGPHLLILKFMFVVLSLPPIGDPRLAASHICHSEVVTIAGNVHQ